jgi:glycosyltransferase involved in cell wall biosynthesis
MLAQAMTSVTAQTRPPDEIHVVTDQLGQGASWTRNQTWRAATSDWVAFLDDDDVWFPQHLERLLDASADADVVYPWFELSVGNQSDPLACRVDGELRTPLGVEFGDEQARYIREENNFIPITLMVRRALLEEVGGFPALNSPEWPENCCEDWATWRKLLDAGARFKHVPERTWRWNWHGANTMGRPTWR